MFGRGKQKETRHFFLWQKKLVSINWKHPYCTASLFTSCNIFIMLLLQRKNWSSKSYTTSGCNIPQNINKTHTFQQIYNGEYSVVIGSYCLMDSNKNVDSHLVMIVLAGTVFFLHIHSLGVAFSDSQASHQHYYVLNKCCWYIHLN